MRRSSFVSLFTCSLSTLAVPVALALALVGCSSGTATGSETATSTAAASADPISFCESYCTKRATCDSTSDTRTCTSTCENETTTSLKRMRSDVVTETKTCFESSDCRQVLSNQRLGECIDEAKVNVAPTQPTKDFCDSWVKAFARCDVTFERASCLSSMKTYSDATLTDAQTCLDKSCGQLADCITAVFGLSSK